MADLIDRAALLAHFAELKDKSDTLRDKLYLDGVMAVIDVAPTIDPVRHARWVDVPPECSACGIYQPTDDWDQYIDYPHCPYCGARMDVDAPEREDISTKDKSKQHKGLERINGGFAPGRAEGSDK